MKRVIANRRESCLVMRLRCNRRTHPAHFFVTHTIGPCPSLLSIATSIVDQGEFSWRKSQPLPLKALREKTDLPMMECKKALTEAGGDEAKAMQILRDMFKKVQEKRADNVTAEGRVFIAAKPDGSEAAMVEIQCESAPVATGEVLQKFGQAMVEQLLAGPGAADATALMAQKAAGASQSFQEQYEEIVNKIREKIVVNRIVRVKGPVGGYVHHDYKTGVLFVASGTPKSSDVLKDVAMHIAAINPSVTNPEDLEPSIVKKNVIDWSPKPERRRSPKTSSTKWSMAE
jgi:elongation factor Ts